MTCNNVTMVSWGWGGGICTRGEDRLPGIYRTGGGGHKGEGGGSRKKQEWGGGINGKTWDQSGEGDQTHVRHGEIERIKIRGRNGYENKFGVVHKNGKSGLWGTGSTYFIKLGVGGSDRWTGEKNGGGTLGKGVAEKVLKLKKQKKTKDLGDL